MGINNDFFEQCCEICTNKNCSACISKMKSDSARRKRSGYTDRCTEPDKNPDIRDIP